MKAVVRVGEEVQVWLRHVPPPQGVDEGAAEDLRGVVKDVDDNGVRIKLPDGNWPIVIPWENISLIEIVSPAVKDTTTETHGFNMFDVGNPEDVGEVEGLHGTPNVVEPKDDPATDS